MPGFFVRLLEGIRYALDRTAIVAVTDQPGLSTLYASRGAITVCAVRSREERFR